AVTHPSLAFSLEGRAPAGPGLLSFSAPPRPDAGAGPGRHSLTRRLESLATVATGSVRRCLGRFVMILRFVLGARSCWAEPLNQLAAPALNPPPPRPQTPPSSSARIAQVRPEVSDQL